MIVGHIGGSSSGGYEIQKSLRFRASATAYLNRTPASAGNRKTWTWSGWVKRGTMNSSGSVAYPLFAVPTGTTDSTWFEFRFVSDFFYVGGYSTNWRVTRQVFRDPSAWYHIILSVDTTQATANDRLKLYINGTQVTTFSTTNNPTQNADLGINQASATYIGLSNSQYFDGYLAEVNFIDGQALTPDNFGQVSAETGAWIPKKYSGTYGTNGFYLPFNDGSTLGNLTADRSGNGNNWTANNISLTAGATYDSMLDVPTLYADRGNYAVVNPLIGAELSITNGNLTFSGTSASNARTAVGTFLMTSGKWYFEMTSGSTAIRYPIPGIQVENTNWSNAGGGFPGGYAQNGFGYGSDGNKYVNNGAGAAFGSSFTSGDVIGIAVDIDSGKVWASKNGVWQASGDPAAGTNPASTFTAGSAMYPGAGSYSGAGTHQLNFGQRPFAYSPPAGFKALCTKNLPTPSILNPRKHFDVRTFTSSDSVNSITGLSFQPDFVWTKRRDQTYNHDLYDSVRGVNRRLQSNNTNAENTDPDTLTAFNSNGFTLGTNDNANNSPASGAAIAWAWKANGSAVTNTAGTITSQVSANTQAGFSIVTYTGTGANATVGHGLGVAPKMVIVKDRDSTRNWFVLHNSDALRQIEGLNTTSAATSPPAAFNNTAPSSTVFSLSSGVGVNGNTIKHVAYCFAEIPGYSKIGSYTGNGSADGPFVYCGFRPRYVLIKSSSLAEGWIVFDTARNTTNVMNAHLYPHLSNGETISTGNLIDITSNGFKLRGSDTALNGSGASYIFYAVAEQPFQFANAR